MLKTPTTYLTSLLTAALFSATVASAAPDPTEDLMEGFFEFRYSGIVDDIVGSKYDGSGFYISLGDVFQSLRLNLSQDPAGETASGFFVATDRPYHIDFAAGVMTMDGATVAFDSTAYVSDLLGFYLAPELYRTFFGLQVSLDMRRLRLSVETAEEMPVVSEYRRRSSRRVETDIPVLRTHLPLRFGRERSIFRGGVAAYRFNTVSTHSGSSANLHLRTGSELLGGDLVLSATAGLSEQALGGLASGFAFDSWRWTYDVAGTRALNQIQVGQISSRELVSIPMAGARITNQPKEAQRLFGSYPLRIETGAGWEVEIWLNGSLIEVAYANASGIVHTAVPIGYGPTAVSIREFGPNGETRESKKVVQVPFSLVPQGALRYSVSAGRTDRGGRSIARTAGSAGLADWLTVNAGVDLAGAGTAESGELPVSGQAKVDQLSTPVRAAWAGFSARIASSYVFAGRVSAGSLYNASLTGFYASSATLKLDFSAGGDHALYRSGSYLHRSRASLTVPFKVGRRSLTSRTTLEERRVSGRAYTFSYQQDLSLQRGATRFALGFRGRSALSGSSYRGTLASVEPRVAWVFSRGAGTPAPVRGMSVSLRSGIDMLSGKPMLVRADVGRLVARSVRVNADLRHDFRRGGTSAGFRITFDLEKSRTVSSMTSGANGRSTFSTTVSGAASFDRGTHRLDFSARDWVGRSAATIRVFVDHNGDGVRNADEPLIPHADVVFERPVERDRDGNGLIRVYNLQASERYSLRIDQSRIRNPFLVPRFSEFSFVTDPNSHKIVDIPFDVAGEISGEVLFARDEGLQSVPGLKIRIRQVDGDLTFTEPVFSDGTFYRMGIPPGTYELTVDPGQLSALKAVASPGPVHFEVRKTRDGDVVTDLDITLIPAGTIMYRDATVVSAGPEESEAATAFEAGS